MVHMMATIVLFVLLFASTAQYIASSRYQLQEADFTNKSDNATVANFTASHENKIVLIFCHKTKCGTTWEDCYCCINKKPEELCYDTMNECRSNCPICDPKCPPQ
ncbi:hypothetical protein PVAP13_9KG108681 [Panicum virgatum]|uniref:Embryo surrounding factor 1 brassicaceae domain-containing protein n=1 Tax=Panicum virgatum TaxID=38727 RepID=A0A8T0NC86_PANVG|nr:hypothetical protein PVAP13_9KG108681 [Panicum virgatum]